MKITQLLGILIISCFVGENSSATIATLWNSIIGENSSTECRQLAPGSSEYVNHKGASCFVLNIFNLLKEREEAGLKGVTLPEGEDITNSYSWKIYLNSIFFPHPDTKKNDAEKKKKGHFSDNTLQISAYEVYGPKQLTFKNFFHAGSEAIPSLDLWNLLIKEMLFKHHNSDPLLPKERVADIANKFKDPNQGMKAVVAYIKNLRNTDITAMDTIGWLYKHEDFGIEMDMTNAVDELVEYHVKLAVNGNITYSVNSINPPNLKCISFSSLF